MKISGVKIPAGVTITAPAPEQEQPQAPSASKFVVGAYADDNQQGAAYVYNLDGTGEVKITASDGVADDKFGYSVAVSYAKIVVGSYNNDDSGSNSGSAYVYNLDGTGEVKITPSDAVRNDYSGWSVAVSGTKVAVGAPFNDDSGSNSGSAYVYNTDGTGEVKITASDGAVNDYFGHSVAIHGDKVIVGAYKDDDRGADSGSVYVYNLDGTGEVKITASDGAADNYFGQSVAIQGDKIFVGAPLNDDGAGSMSGSVYVYDTDGTGEVKITASDGAANDSFGHSVAIHGDKIIVGANGDDDSGNSSGSAYVYNLDGTGEVKITASDAAANDYFGSSVAIQGDKIVVGAYGDDDSGSNSGSVYVYNLDGTGEVKITASDGAASDRFGGAVYTDGQNIFVGAGDAGYPAEGYGSVYIYNMDGTGEQKIVPTISPAGGGFGWSIA